MSVKHNSLKLEPLAARTGTRGLARVDGKTAVTTAAHERAMLGAGGTSFGRTVRATANVGCARHTTRARDWPCTNVARIGTR